MSTNTTKRRDSRWTSIYWGTTPGKAGVHPFVRLTPDFMDLEAAGFSHGLGLGHGPFESESEAIKAADAFDRFFDAMLDDLEMFEAERRIVPNEDADHLIALIAETIDGSGVNEERLISGGFVRTTYEGQEGIFLTKRVSLERMPAAFLRIKGDEFIDGSSESVTEIIPPSRVSGPKPMVHLHVPDADYVEGPYLVESDDGKALIEDALAARQE